MLHSYQHAWVQVENATKDGAQPMHTHSSDRGVNMRAVVQMRKWNTIKGVKDMGMIKILLVFVGTVNYAICFDDISIE